MMYTNHAISFLLCWIPSVYSLSSIDHPCLMLFSGGIQCLWYTFLPWLPCGNLLKEGAEAWLRSSNDPRGCLEQAQSHQVPWLWCVLLRRHTETWLSWKRLFHVVQWDTDHTHFTHWDDFVSLSIMYTYTYTCTCIIHVFDEFWVYIERQKGYPLVV